MLKSTSNPYQHLRTLVLIPFKGSSKKHHFLKELLHFFTNHVEFKIPQPYTSLILLTIIMFSMVPIYHDPNSDKVRQVAHSALTIALLIPSQAINHQRLHQDHHNPVPHRYRINPPAESQVPHHHSFEKHDQNAAFHRGRVVAAEGHSAVLSDWGDGLCTFFVIC